MRLKSNYMHVLASFIAAFAVGTILQSGDADAPIFANNDADEANALLSEPLVDPNSVQHASAPAWDVFTLPVTPIETLEAPNFATAALIHAKRTQETLEPNPVKDAPKYSAYGVPCSTSLVATAGSAAMISIKLSASCAPKQTFVLRQGDLEITGITSLIGNAEMMVPAMSSDPEISITFSDGQSVSTDVHVEDFSNYDRVALLWQGRSGLEIHALEFGSEYGQPGHVWKEAPRSLTHATGSLGGFMTRIGEVSGSEAKHAEIYSFPTGTVQRNGAVRLSVEAEITPFNCGREISAQTLQPNSNSGLEVVELVLAMPDCGAIGDFLVLNNLLRDLKIALN